MRRTAHVVGLCILTALAAAAGATAAMPSTRAQPGARTLIDGLVAETLPVRDVPGQQQDAWGAVGTVARPLAVPHDGGLDGVVAVDVAASGVAPGAPLPATVAVVEVGAPDTQPGATAATPHPAAPPPRVPPAPTAPSSTPAPAHATPTPPAPSATPTPSPAPTAPPPPPAPGTQDQVIADIRAAAAAAGVNGDCMVALARRESGLNPLAVNAAGPYDGLFQFWPATFSSNGGTNIWDPVDQSRVASRMMAAGRGPGAWGVAC